MKQLIVLICGALSSLHCGSSSEAVFAPFQPTGGDQASDDQASDDQASDDECARGPRQDRPVPELVCSEAVHACDESVPISCISSPFASASIELLQRSCNFYCGQLEVRFHQGCVTLVDGVVNGIEGVSDLGEGMECIRQQLFGTRWQCGPSDGWVSVYLGSCTTL